MGFDVESAGLIAAVAAVVGVLLGAVPQLRSATRRAIVRRHLLQALQLQKELPRDDERLAPVHLALGEVIEFSATTLALIEHRWTKRAARRMGQRYVGILLMYLIAVALVYGAIVLNIDRRVVNLTVYVYVLLAVVGLVVWRWRQSRRDQAEMARWTTRAEEARGTEAQLTKPNERL